PAAAESPLGGRVGSTRYRIFVPSALRRASAGTQSKVLTRSRSLSMRVMPYWPVSPIVSNSALDTRYEALTFWSLVFTSCSTEDTMGSSSDVRVVTGRLVGATAATSSGSRRSLEQAA